MSDFHKRLFNQSWNYKYRSNIIKRLQEASYDVIIIGAGITGAGIAREASMRNLKTAIIDMQDFGAGTSSRSSKLAHGGLRYLTHGDMDVVRESATERNWLIQHLPHLVRPLPFLFVELKDGKYNKRTIVNACKIYDFLGEKDSEFKNFKKYKWYSAEEIFELEPEFIREGNKGGAIYYDANVDDARLTIETIKEAVIRGADALNYCRVNGYIKDKGKISGVRCRDIENNEDFDIKGTLIVNATGIWTDDLLENYPDDIPKPLIRPTKGVHLQYRRENVKNKNATIIHSPIDGRAIFVLPRNEDFTIIGTTDTDYNGDLAKPFCNKEDADYLITSVQYFFPNAKLDYDKIISTYAGIRPLVMQKGKSESDVSRKHVVFFSEDGLLTITGGKLTAFRSMAEDLFKHIEEKNLFQNIKKPENFSKQKYHISLEREEWINQFENSGIVLDNDIADHLYQQYGRGALKILELIKEDNSLKERIVKDNYFINAEIIYSLKFELTPHLVDIFCRRTEMSLWITHNKASEAAQEVADLMAKEFGWNNEKKTKEIDFYLNYIQKTISFIK